MDVYLHFCFAYKLIYSFGLQTGTFIDDGGGDGAGEYKIYWNVKYSSFWYNINAWQVYWYVYIFPVRSTNGLLQDERIINQSSHCSRHSGIIKKNRERGKTNFIFYLHKVLFFIALYNFPNSNRSPFDTPSSHSLDTMWSEKKLISVFLISAFLNLKSHLYDFCYSFFLFLVDVEMKY
jgi:hypothetical protein